MYMDVPIKPPYGCYFPLISERGSIYRYPQWSAAAEYAKKVMDAGFSLAPNYGDNFLADNNTSPEMILPICYDGVQTRSWSGLFFIASFISGDMNALDDFGTKEAWW